MVPEGVRVVSALHTVSAASLSDLDHPLDAGRARVRRLARGQAPRRRALIERIDGLRCVDCGRLEMARTTEALTALLIAVNARYKAHAGIRLTSLPERAVGVTRRADIVVLAGRHRRRQARARDRRRSLGPERARRDRQHRR